MEPEAVPAALAALGWSDRALALFNDLAQPGDEPARVVRVERGHAVVVGRDGADRLVRAGGPVAVGDWAVLDGSAIRALLPRWAELSRKDPGVERAQVLAANADLVVVAAPADRLSTARVEREVAMGWQSGGTPVVVLTKYDLAAPDTLAGLEDRLAGVDILATSVVTGTGVDELASRLRPDRTAVLLGPSGAGKSALANALLGTEQLRTASVRTGDRRGRHTTTSRQLVPVPGGGVLIDTPGLRSLGLAGGEGIGEAFPDVEELAAGCRFSDCRHATEPGCAVQAAVAGGDLDGARLASFRKLEREWAADARRHDPLLARSELEVWKARMREARARSRPRRR